MPSGTELNGIFANRIHKSNAREVSDNAHESLRRNRDKILILASASRPDSMENEDWMCSTLNTVDEIWEELEEYFLVRFMADYIINNPGDCKDELVAADYPEGAE